MDENKRAEITLSTNGYSGRYDSYFVKIIHKDNRKIVAKNFLFDEYMDIADSTSEGIIYMWEGLVFKLTMVLGGILLLLPNAISNDWLMQ